jgi:hypothetical protein
MEYNRITFLQPENLTQRPESYLDFFVIRVIECSCCSGCLEHSFIPAFYGDVILCATSTSSLSRYGMIFFRLQSRISLQKTSCFPLPSESYYTLRFRNIFVIEIWNFIHFLILKHNRFYSRKSGDFEKENDGRFFYLISLIKIILRYCFLINGSRKSCIRDEYRRCCPSRRGRLRCCIFCFEFVRISASWLLLFESTHLNYCTSLRLEYFT